MPPLPGFSDNLFRTRDDVVRATVALLQPLGRYTSPAGARIRLPAATGAKFDESAAQLEGFARPLWAVASLLAAHDSQNESIFAPLLQPWVDGIAAGTDPAHPEYWGAMGDFDQRMVESEIVAYALLAAPGPFFHNQSPHVQRNIVAWLRSINGTKGVDGRGMPANNWRWFRVLTNLALIQVCGEPADELRSHMDADLALLDSFVLGLPDTSESLSLPGTTSTAGWSSDGEWQTDYQIEDAETQYQRQRLAGTGVRRDTMDSGRASRQADYYSGSFAIQFSQLVYCRFVTGSAPPGSTDADKDAARVRQYRKQARQFGDSFWAFFDGAGATIPFGRSQTYRFACVGFFAAQAVAGLTDDDDDGIDGVDSVDWGATKGFLLRHMRWWAAHGDDALNADGTMNIGWLYPNMFMCESYNSPQSVYWCLKTLLVVALPTSHPFWTAEEKDYPYDHWMKRPVRLVPAPRQILCNHPAGNHHFLLSTTQYATWPLKAAQAKYSKFAYSSAFPFSVATGTRLEQLAPDNALALTRDEGVTWAVKGQAMEPIFSVTPVYTTGSGVDAVAEEVTTATVRWYPWPDRSADVVTTLIPPTAAWPDWHVRVHRIRVRGNARGGRPSLAMDGLDIVEGGFAGPGQKQAGDGFDLPKLGSLLDGTTLKSGVEGYLQTESSTLILSYAGATGMSTDVVTVKSPGLSRKPLAVHSTCSPLRTDPNTSLAFQRSLLPVAEHALVGDLEAGTEIVLVSKIFAISTQANCGRGIDDIDVKARWSRPPVVALEPRKDKTESSNYIALFSDKGFNSF